MPRAFLLPSLSSRSLLLLSRSAPRRLPLLASYSSWRSREAGWLGLLSLRLPGLWLLWLRRIPSREKLSRLGLHGLP
jgi:hypothetical protein